jgi:phenylacetate-CoA ligase
MKTDDRGWKLYWDEERETLDPAERRRIILERVQRQLQYVYAEIPFYRRHYDAHDFHPDQVRHLEDFTEKVPIITKKALIADQAEHPPFGSYAGPFHEKDIARIHGSSGTSGRPTLYRVSREDWDRAAEVHAMAQWSMGIRPDDILQVSFPFSLFFGGWGINQGAQRLGCTVFPLGVMPSERQLELMQTIGSTVFTATPSYALHLAAVAEKMGIDLAAGPVKRLMIGGEPGGCVLGTKKAIQSLWGATTHDAGSTSEMYPFQTNVEEASSQGMHCIIDEVYTEVVDKDDANAAVPYGTRGAVVYTHLWRRSQPMIRFWPGDETEMHPGPTPLGRTYPMLPKGIIGRLDDMLVVRGANLYPSTVETALRAIEDLGPEFELLLEKRGALDEITARVELRTEVQRGWEGLSPPRRAEVEQDLLQRTGAMLKRVCGIRVGVELLPPGTLPETVFKARRVRDLRGTSDTADGEGA